MPELSGIYDSFLVQPVCRIKENISVMTQGGWAHYVVDFLEPLPPGPASIVDMVALQVPVVTFIGANANFQKTAVPILQPTERELLHLRWKPLDLVEGVLWELSGALRFNAMGFTARVDRFTELMDPTLATTTFWVLGQARNMLLETRNPNPVALPAARFQFWGFRYLLSKHPRVNDGNVAKLAVGDPDYVTQVLGKPTTWLPAQAMQGG